jgi:hypothetical protein
MRAAGPRVRLLLDQRSPSEIAAAAAAGRV